MVFTIHEAYQVRNALGAVESISKEFADFSLKIRLLRLFFGALAAIRSVFVFTFIYALINQESDIYAVWNSGNGIGAMFVYLFLSIIPIIGSLVVFLTPFFVIIESFILGDGINKNLPQYLLPIAAAYLLVAAIVMITNYIMETYTERNYPNIYKVLKWVHDEHGFDQPFNETDILMMDVAAINRCEPEHGIKIDVETGTYIEQVTTDHNDTVIDLNEDDEEL